MLQRETEAVIEMYFRRAFTLRRMRAGLLGEHIDGFASALRDAAYSRWTVRGYLRAAAHLSTWIKQDRLGRCTLDEALVGRFSAHLSGCSCLGRNTGRYEDAVCGVRHFIDYIVNGQLAPAPPRRAEKPVPAMLVDFENWMRRHRGVTDATLGAYRSTTIELVQVLGEEPRHYTAATLRRFLLTRAARHGRSYAINTLSATRMFLRYLAVHGRCSPRLVDAVPAMTGWRKTALPKYLAAADVDRIVEACDATTLVGLRDRAIVLLLARLGLRAGDVAALSFEDIDWTAGKLEVSGKGRRAARLPLPQDAGDAILAYLAKRPAASTDRIFLRARPPHGPFGYSSAVSYIVNRAADRAGVELPRTGAHILRHSLATDLLRRGATLDSIGRLLRHRDLQTTVQYAKVDVELLRHIARPWPEEIAA